MQNIVPDHNKCLFDWRPRGMNFIRAVAIKICIGLLVALIVAVRAFAATPSAIITDPQSGAAFSENYVISGNASDTVSVSDVMLTIRALDTDKYWNGTNFQTAFVRVPANLTGPKKNRSWTYSATPTSPGTYAIMAWVWNTSSEYNTSPSVWYTVSGPTDNQAPSVSLSNITSGGRYGAPLQLSGVASDNVSVNNVKLALRNLELQQYWNGTAFQNTFVRVNAILSGTEQSPDWLYNNFPEIAGTYTVSARSWDEAGNYSSASTAWFTVTNEVADTEPPSTTIESPAFFGQTLSSPYQLSGSYNDDTEIDRVELAIRHISQGTYWDGTNLTNGYVRVPATLSGNGLQGEWLLNNTPEVNGDYVVSVWSWDTSQNFANPSATQFKVSSTSADNESPVVAFSAAVSATTVQSPVVLSGTASDNLGIDRVELVIRNDSSGQYWNGVSYQSGYVRVPAVLSSSGASVNWFYNDFPSEAGGYSMSAWAWDTSQNTPSSITTWLVVNSSTPAPPGVDISKYNLVFSDEFNGSALDPNRWNTSFYWGPYKTINAEEQFYMDSLGMHSDADFTPFEFTGDSLIINAVETSANLLPPNQPPETDPIWLNDPDKSYTPDFNPSDSNYLSGIITSVENFNFTHGYVEARVKLPVGRGLWPAFWLLNTKYVEDSPEIDIMEYLGQDTNKVYHTYHYFDVDNNWAKISTPTYETIVDDLTEYHTVGLAWEADQLIWFVDGVETRRVTDANLTISKQSMYVIANMAVGGAWPGSPDSSTQFPAKYELDYIRVYQKKPVTPITPSVLQSEFQLMFSEEFNSNTLDSNKWNTSFLWGPYFPINSEEQIYIDEFGHHADFPISPFSIANGQLSIRAEPIAANQLPVQPPIGSSEWLSYPSQQYYGPYNQPDGWTPGYSSGILTSYDAFKFVHGYVEMRAQVPEGAGLWPAFWLLNGYYVGPQPEIDIMELKGEEPGNVHHSYHFSGSDGILNSSATQYSLPTGESFSDGFHTFGLEWLPGTLKWYVDGQVTRTLNSDDVSLQLMYIIVNLAVGGNFVGPVDASSTPAEFTIDYIRAYQRKSTP